MFSAIRVFFAIEGAKPWIVVICLLAAGLAEGFGIATLLPLLTVVQGGPGTDSAIGRVFEPLIGDLSYGATVTVLLALVVTGIALKAALTMLAMRYVGYTVAEVSTRLRTRIIRQLLAVRWTYLLSHPTGRFVNAVSQQVGQTVEAFKASASLMAILIETVVLTTVALIVSWQVAIAALVVTTLIAVLLRGYIARARKAGRTTSKRNRELVALLTETMNNLKPVKAMARQQGFSTLFEQKIRSLRKAARKQVMSKEALKNLKEVIVAVFLALSGWVALVAMRIPVADLLVVSVLLLRTVRSMSRVQEQYQLVVGLQHPFEEIQGLLKETEAEAEQHVGTKKLRLAHGIRFEKVRFGYGDREILRDCSLEIPFGKLVVITGASGVGKTTLVDLVLGLHQPDAGRILLDGTPLSEVDIIHWRSQVGYVAQELALLNDTVAANISLGQKDLSKEDMERALQLAGVLEVVEALPKGLSTVVGDKGAKLSGGQRQRIALARALVGRPRLLVLDEVTSALDPTTEQQICANIRTLTEETAVLAITHRPAFLEWADMVYRVQDGGAVLETPEARAAALAEHAVI